MFGQVFNNTLIRPYFIKGNLTSVKYEDMLKIQILPQYKQ